MKILHLITTIDRGGAENQLLTLVKQQVKEGDEIYVAALKGELELASHFEKSGAKVYSDIANKPWLMQIIPLRKFIKKENITLVHAHLPRAEITAAMCAPKQKFIVTRHNSESFFPGVPKEISSALSRCVTSRAYLVTCISHSVKEFVLNHKEAKGDVDVIYYGKDSKFRHRRDCTKRESFLTELGLPKDTFVITTLARLEPQKDLITLLSAFKPIAYNDSRMCLLIGGSGKLEQKLKAYASNIGITNQVIWLGQVTNTEKIYNAGDLFILTSKYEGFGLVLLEAMEYRIPIIAANNTAIPEVIGFEHPGLVATGDIHGFSEKIKEFTQPDFRATVLDYQELQLPKFDIKVTSASYSKIYKTINSL